MVQKTFMLFPEKAILGYFSFSVKTAFLKSFRNYVMDLRQ